MKIGELAEQAGISVSTIRFYERQGLMPEPNRRESGYREYAETDVDRLRLIVAAKKRRFPLSIIRLCLDAVDGADEPCGEIARIVETRLKEIEQEITDLSTLRGHLRAQLQAWRAGSLPAADCLCAILQTDALNNTEKSPPPVEVRRQKKEQTN
ncbi:MAG: MerR family transcriptional regulator [Armatimonadetes bacterium]|nr:MerR family transcriptional regulator [Armatimonadota bacterium]